MTALAFATFSGSTSALHQQNAFICDRKAVFSAPTAKFTTIVSIRANATPCTLGFAAAGNPIFRSEKSTPKLLTGQAGGNSGNKDDDRRRKIRSQATVNPSMTLWQRYYSWLEIYPLLTKAITSAVLSGTGDLIAQYLESNFANGINFSRFGRMAFLGGGLVAPTLHNWYGFLEEVLGGGKFGGGFKEVMVKLVADQTVFAPIFTAVFFIAISVLEGCSVAEIKSKLGAPYLGAMKMNYKIWPAAQVVTFAMIPPNLRVLFANVVGLCWNVILSMAANRKAPQLTSLELSMSGSQAPRTRSSKKSSQ